MEGLTVPLKVKKRGWDCKTEGEVGYQQTVIRYGTFRIHVQGSGAFVGDGKIMGITYLCIYVTEVG